MVDLDPEMTWLGTEYAPLVRLNQDALANDKVTIHNMDAFLYVRDTDKIYDRVIIDFLIPIMKLCPNYIPVNFTPCSVAWSQKMA